MGLFSRKPKQQPAAEQPPGSPLSPPEARYVNARPPTPQQHQPQFQQAQQQQTQQQQQRQQQRQQQASSDRPQQQRYQRAGPSRPESPLPQAPFQQPRASNSYSRPQHSQATFDRSSAALNSDVNDDGELDDGGRVRVGQSAMPPPATAASSSSSSASSYRWQPPSPPPLERESSDPARWQLPALGLSPPTSLAPLGLGLRTDDSMAGSDSNSLRGSASATSPPPPKSAGGSELGRGYPSSPATVDDRSRTSLPRCAVLASVRLDLRETLLIEAHLSRPMQRESDDSCVSATGGAFVRPPSSSTSFRPFLLRSIALARTLFESAAAPVETFDGRSSAEQLSASAFRSAARADRLLRRRRSRRR